MVIWAMPYENSLIIINKRCRVWCTCVLQARPIGLNSSVNLNSDQFYSIGSTMDNNQTQGKECIIFIQNTTLRTRKIHTDHKNINCVENVPPLSDDRVYIYYNVCHSCAEPSNYHNFSIRLGIILPFNEVFNMGVIIWSRGVETLKRLWLNRFSSLLKANRNHQSAHFYWIITGRTLVAFSVTNTIFFIVCHTKCLQTCCNVLETN